MDVNPRGYAESATLAPCEVCRVRPADKEVDPASKPKSPMRESHVSKSIELNIDSYDVFADSRIPPHSGRDPVQGTLAKRAVFITCR